MTTTQFVDELQEQLGGTKTDIRAIAIAVMDKIISTVSGGENVQIGNHHFKLVTRKPRKGHNPRTGEPIEIGERRFVMFKKRV